MKNARIKNMEAMVDKWLDDLAGEAEFNSGVSVGALLGMSVGRVIKAELSAKDESLPLDGNFRDIQDQYRNDTLHIRDWLVGAVLRRDRWLDRLNPDGVPLKLAKSGRFEQIVDEANKAMRKLNSRGVGVAVTSDMVHEFGNGYVMVQLKTSAELEVESSMMQHCVGLGAYHGAVESDRTRIYSLRDSHGKAHVTIEVDVSGLSVEQVKGKQNRLPRIDYFEMVVDWLNTQNYEFGCDDLPPGFAVDNKGKLVNVTKLKDGDEFDGDLTIRVEDVTVPYLPRNLTVTGFLHISKPGLVAASALKLELPEGLVVQGDFSLTGVHVVQEKEFPGRAVYLDHCVIEKLPARIAQTTTITLSKLIGDFSEGIIFERLLVLSSSSLRQGRLLDRSTFLNNLNLDGDSATMIPDGLRVAGDLKITKASCVFFDGSVDVGGSMVVSDSRIEGDPSRLHVGRTLHVHRSKMRMLPDDTVIGTDLILSSVSDIRTLPRSVQVGRGIRIDDAQIVSLEGRKEFNGELCLHRTAVKELAAGTVVRGMLKVSNLPMERLPSDLVVQEDLCIGPCPIKRIPSSAKIGNNLILRGSTVVAVPEGYNIPGDLDITGIGSFRIPPGVTIGRNLIANGAGIEELPHELSVHSIFAAGSSLQSLPRRLSIEGDLDVRSSRIDRVPATLSVGGSADFRKTAIQTIPASVYIGGELSVDDNVIVDRLIASQPTHVPRFG
jgi:hypothetical protein